MIPPTISRALAAIRVQELSGRQRDAAPRAKSPRWGLRRCRHSELANAGNPAGAACAVSSGAGPGAAARGRRQRRGGAIGAGGTGSAPVERPGRPQADHGISRLDGPQRSVGGGGASTGGANAMGAGGSSAPAARAATDLPPDAKCYLRSARAKSVSNSAVHGADTAGLLRGVRLRASWGTKEDPVIRNPVAHRQRQGDSPLAPLQ